ncbi:hypothetical protein EZV77_26785 [Burkholderia thailandensis]|nr:hypothetical protein A8H32_25415 [Burkholderia thailandensis]MDD1483897.1 hypothetical protein [Burkholderia thailandensis]MDD1490161.1 hypothetical protein [Burkholderia thailandensis]MDD1496089.1 hypothetical protein [Burkholderia thailandensis]PJO69895.1 hypothetical protein CWD92_24530 [Burkholderia thailandensis]
MQSRERRTTSPAAGSRRLAGQPASMPRRASRGTAGIGRCGAPGAQPRVSIQFRAQRAEWRTASSSL